jgi:hypothetical protein
MNQFIRRRNRRRVYRHVRMSWKTCRKARGFSGLTCVNPWIDKIENAGDQRGSRSKRPKKTRAAPMA